MWYDAVVQLASKIDVTPYVTRSTGRQTQRNNVPALNPKEYFKRAKSIPFLDHIMQELHTR